MITTKNLRKSFGDLEVLKGVDLQVAKGEIVAVIGTSGAGKTTLLQILGTLDRPSNSSDCILEINGKSVLNLGDDQLALFRNKEIGFVFQFHQLLPEFTALENICMPALIQNTSLKEAKKKALPLMKKLGIDHRAHHKPSELSGGEQQRVAVARALINSPSVVFADEPTGNLDSNSAKNLHDLFLSLREELNQTFVIVTHNKELAALADRTLTMQDGRIVHSK